MTQPRGILSFVVFAGGAARPVRIVFVSLMLAWLWLFSRVVSAQTSSFDISAPASEAKACVADVKDPILLTNITRCQTLASSNTLKFLGLPLQQIDTGVVTGSATFRNAGNTALAQANPANFLGFAAAVTEAPGSAAAFSFWDVTLKSKTTGQPKPGTLEVILVADARASAVQGMGGIWTIQMGGYNCAVPATS